MLERRGPVVGVLGSYGGRNLGDEAILTSLLADLRAWRPDAQALVFSRHPEHTRAAHEGVAVAGWEGVSRDAVAEALAGVDLLVLGGGGILYDTEARKYLRVVNLARERQIPVFTYAVGAGPLTEATDCTMVSAAMAHALEVTVRDEESRVALEEAGVECPITVTADPALLLAPEEFDAATLRAEWIPPGRRLVGMSVREPGRAAQHLADDEYHQLLAHVGDYLIHRLDAHVLFVPMERSDIRHAYSVMSRMAAAEHCRVLHGNYGPRQILGLMRHLDLAVGMRLHFLIFAALSGVPLLALPYAGKVFDFAQQIGAPVPRGVGREAAGPLLAQVDRLWDERPQRSAETDRRVAALRVRATETGRRLAVHLDRIASPASDAVTSDGTGTVPTGAAR